MVGNAEINWIFLVAGADAEFATVIHQLPPSTPSSSSSLITEQTRRWIVLWRAFRHCRGWTIPTRFLLEIVMRNANHSNKLVWNKPSNGVIVETSPIMGAESWPTLSASTKGYAKLPTESSSKTIADESLSNSQVWFKCIPLFSA